MNFWDVLKEVSARAIRLDADRVFVLGLAGNPHVVGEARRIVLGPAPDERTLCNAREYLCCLSPPHSPEEEERLRHCDLLVSLPGGPERTAFRPADTIQLAGTEQLLESVLERREDLRVSLARRLPGFRQLAAEQVITGVSRVNAEFAAVSGASQAIPVLGPLFPAVVGADLLMLTKNQVMMLLRLAAIYDQSLDVRDRFREVVAVIGSGFGWRGLARGAAALLPGPLALGLKITVAYAATYVVGRAAQVVLDEGREPTRQELQRIYEDSARLARETAAEVLEEVGKLGRSVRERCLPDRGSSIREAVVAEQAALLEGAAPDAGAAQDDGDGASGALNDRADDSDGSVEPEAGAAP